MLDLGWPELLVVALVLIIVVGPKDLPAMLRTFGRTTKKLRTMAGEFRSQFDEALKEAELDDVREAITDAQKLNPKNMLKDVVDPIRNVGNEIKADLDKTAKAATPPSLKKTDAPETDTAKPMAAENAKTSKPAVQKPATAAGKPATAAGKPATAAGKPATAAGKPASNGKAPKTAAKKSAGTTAKRKSPSVAGGGRKTTAKSAGKTAGDKKQSSATTRRSASAAAKSGAESTDKTSGDTA